MTFLDALRGPETRASVESPLVPLTSTTLLDWMSAPKSSAGISVTESSSLGMSAVWRAVNLIAGTCASLPLHAYLKDDDDVQRRVPANQRPAILLRDPHPDMTRFEVWEVAYAHLALWGNAYLQTLRNGAGQITELWPIHPSRVKPGRAKDLTKVYVIDGDLEHPKFDDGILHIPGFGYDGVMGLSPIQLARQGIGLSLAAEEYGAKLFGSGSLASGLLTTEKGLTEPQATALKERWAAKTKGMQNAHEVAILDNGAKFQQLSIPPEDAQFIESRRFQVAEVARMFGVPPHMLMETDKSTSWGSGIEQQGIGFVVYTLRPWLTRVEQRVSRMLKPDTIFASYSVEGLLRGDSTQRAAFYKAMWEIGVYSTNDILRLENQAPVDGGNIRYRPLNMGVLGEPDPSGTPAVEPANQGAAA